MENWPPTPSVSEQDAEITKLQIEITKILDRLNEVINRNCTCGGAGPDDAGYCDACEIWHEIMKGV